MIIDAIVVLGAGALAGFLAGLLGIGGGLVIVPALALVLDARAPEYAMHVAVGTSLASIVFTGIASVHAHHRRGAVAWASVRRLAPSLLAGSLGAGLLAAWVPSLGLAILFSAFCFVAAWQLTRTPGQQTRSASAGTLELGAVGLSFGAISALVGIGGGSLNVPYLTWRGLPIHQAIGTAAACGLPIAVAGTLGSVISGWSIEGLPEPRLGFVILPMLLGILITSVPAAPLGARAAHALPTASLRRVFAVFLVFMGLLLAARIGT